MPRRFIASLLPLAALVACSSDAPTSSSSQGGSAGSVGAAGATSGAGGAGSGGGGAASAGSGAGTSPSQTGGGGGAGMGGAASAGNGGTGGQGAALQLHITSSNIRYGTAADGINAWDARKALLIEVLKAQTFDSAGLQEALAFQLDELDDALPDYARVGVGRDDGQSQGEFSAILYLKDRYEAVASGTFWLSDTPEEPGSMTWGNTLPRICSWARLKHLESGRHYYHFNAHLDHLSQPSREKSVALIATRIAARPEQSEPVILTGDFNAEPDNLAIEYLLGSAPIENMSTPATLVDAWLSLHAGDASSTTYHAWNGGMTGGTHIDYVMFGSGVSAKSSEIVFTHEGDVYPSDHYPVSAVLELSP